MPLAERIAALNARLAAAGHADRIPTTGARASLPPRAGAYASLVPLLVEAGGRLGLLIATDERRRAGGFLLRALVLFDADGLIVEVADPLTGDRLRSITRTVPAAHWQERDAAEMFGLALEDHPEPYRHHLHEHVAPDYHPLRKDAAGPVPTAPPGTLPPAFRAVTGAGVHEIPVGPIHAGIIEPGHFRFFAVGERILHLQIRLGWQHKGIEKSLEGLRPSAGVALAERISGDTTIGHAWAYCQALEDASSTEVPPRALHLRALALELERLANHVGDLGGLSTDIGYAFGSAHFGRLRGEFLNRTEVLTGNRFGRSFLAPGGVRAGVDDAMARDLLAWLPRVRADYRDVADELFSAGSVQARMNDCAILSPRAARAFGLVGPAARASGIAHDTRLDFRHAPYAALAVHCAVEPHGDVAARAKLRHAEILQSLDLLDALLGALPAGPERVPLLPLPPFRAGLGQIEAWRGEILTWVMAGDDGLLWRVRVRDPSTQNWIGVALAIETNQVTDFPLCNKSFNLSYYGTDL